MMKGCKGYIDTPCLCEDGGKIFSEIFLIVPKTAENETLRKET